MVVFKEEGVSLDCPEKDLLKLKNSGCFGLYGNYRFLGLKTTTLKYKRKESVGSFREYLYR